MPSPAYSVSTIERRKQQDINMLGKATGSLRRMSRKIVVRNKFSVVVVGAAGSGKSAVTMRFMNGEFVEEYEPTVSHLLDRSGH